MVYDCISAASLTLLEINVICRVSVSGLILHEQEKSGLFQPFPHLLLKSRAWQLKPSPCISGREWDVKGSYENQMSSGRREGVSLLLEVCNNPKNVLTELL